MNHELLGNFHKKHLDNLVTDLEELFCQIVRVISNDMGWDDGFFRYISYRELSPDERYAMLRAKNRKAYEKRFSISTTYKRVLAFKFEYDGEFMEMTVDLPYIHNYSIMRDGTPYYPIFAITDRGGLCHMKDAVLLQVMRTKLIFKRGKVRRVNAVESGVVISECSVTAKINQSKKGHKEPPPIILHHLANMGFEETLKLYGVDDAIELTNTCTGAATHYHVDIGNGCYLRINRDKLTVRVKRVIVGLHSIFTFYPNFTFEGLHDKSYFIIVTGKWNNKSQSYEVHLMANALEYMRMNNTLIDPQHQAQHRSIGIEYEDLDGLMLFMFDNIDKLMASHSRNRIDMFRKRIAGTDMIKLKLFEIINYRVFTIVNSRYTKQTPDIRNLMYHLDYRKAIAGIKIFRRAPMLYSDNALAVIGLRFTTLTSMEINDSRGGRTKIPINLLVMHPSYLSTVSILTYPSSRPISTGSINGFVEVDDQGNIQEPHYVDELRGIYGNIT
jgi:hypothetical protein